MQFKTFDIVYSGASELPLEVERALDQCSSGNLSSKFHKDAFYLSRENGTSLARYVVGYRNGSVVGVVPLCFAGGPESVPELEMWEFNGSLYHCEFEPPVPPKEFVNFVPHLPGVDDYMTNFRYWQATGLHTYKWASGLFELPLDFESYLASLDKKSRYNLKTNLRTNSDLKVTFGDSLDLEFASALLPGYKDYWKSRSEETYVDNAIKVEQDIGVFSGASGQGKYAAMYVSYSDGTPAALNLAWVDTGSVTDMLCLRDMSDSAHRRGLGVFCILKNIEFFCGRLSLYNLCPGDDSQKYKNQFYPRGHTIQHERVTIGTALDCVFGKTGFYLSGTGEYVTNSEETFTKLTPSQQEHALSVHRKIVNDS